MSKCFVIQPFNSKEYEKRYKDILKPAIEGAGLEAYRVDEDHSTTVLINAIEQGIEESSVCLAEISEDNPNVWFELGYARAARRPLVMICSNARRTKLPFDIQHRTVIFFDSDSTSDFETLKVEIHRRLEAAKKQSIKQSESRRIENTPSSTLRTLDRNEYRLLAALAEEAGQAGMGETTLWSLEQCAKKKGLSSIDIGIAYRELTNAKVVETREEFGHNPDENYTVVKITDFGWKCIKRSQHLFEVSKGMIGNRQTAPPPRMGSDLDDDIPF